MQNSNSISCWPTGPSPDNETIFPSCSATHTGRIQICNLGRLSTYFWWVFILPSWLLKINSDTLLMVRHDPLKAHFLKGNSLGDVYKRCHDQPFTLRDIPINIPAGYRDYRTFGGQCHEAGFDAFMTGVSFIRMFGFVGKIAKSKEQV